jgi:hypothetical protein
MIGILLSLFLTAATENLKPIEWHLEKKYNDSFVVRSWYLNLPEEHYDYTKYMYDRVFSVYVKRNKTVCVVEPLTIFVISEEQMRDSFATSKEKIHVKYFTERNHLYITLNEIKNEKHVYEGLAAYVFDTCGVKFKSNYKKQIHDFLKGL